MGQKTSFDHPRSDKGTVRSEIQSYVTHSTRSVFLVSFKSLSGLLELDFPQSEEIPALLKKLDKWIKTKTVLTIVFDIQSRSIMSVAEEQHEKAIKGYYPIYSKEN